MPNRVGGHVAATPLPIKILLPASIETVWKAFREPEIIRQWHGWEYDGIDEEIKAIYQDGTTVHQEDRALKIGGHWFAFESTGPDQTSVEVSRVALTGSAIHSLDWDKFYDEVDAGWLSFLQQLRFYLARHRGEIRRTVFLSGDAISANPQPITELLGFGPLPSAGGGQRYRATGVGSPLEGEVWFHTANQIGVTVDSWGDGLLLLAYPPTLDRKFGALSATLTTYGMDGAAFAKLALEWTTWWDDHYTTPAEPP